MTDFPTGLRTRLKLATRELVLAAGGGRFAAAVMGLSEGQVSRCASPDHADTLSLAHLALLELHVGRPIIAAALAELTGYRVEAIDAATDAAGLMSGLCTFARESGSALALLGDALADGKVTPREARAVHAELLDVQACVTELTGRTAALMEGM